MTINKGKDNGAIRPILSTWISYPLASLPVGFWVRYWTNNNNQIV